MERSESAATASAGRITEDSRNWRAGRRPRSYSGGFNSLLSQPRASSVAMGSGGPSHLEQTNLRSRGCLPTETVASTPWHFGQINCSVVGTIFASAGDTRFYKEVFLRLASVESTWHL